MTWVLWDVLVLVFGSWISHFHLILLEEKLVGFSTLWDFALTWSLYLVFIVFGDIHVYVVGTCLMKRT